MRNASGPVPEIQTAPPIAHQGDVASNTSLAPLLVNIFPHFCSPCHSTDLVNAQRHRNIKLVDPSLPCLLSDRLSRLYTLLPDVTAVHFGSL